MEIETIIGRNKYGKYCIPVSSSKTSPPAKKALSGDVYEPKTIEFIISNYKNGDIIHAGAYFGDFLPALSKACRGIVWAFEPKHEHYVCALKTLELNNITNVELRQAGLGEKEQTCQLQIVMDNGETTWGGGSSITQQEKPEDMVEDIAIVSVDETIPRNRNISILHLDVEGFEQQALMGSLNTIQRCLPILIVETLPTGMWLSEFLFPLGYKVIGKVHRNTILRVSK